MVTVVTLVTTTMTHRYIWCRVLKKCLTYSNENAIIATKIFGIAMWIKIIAVTTTVFPQFLLMVAIVIFGSAMTVIRHDMWWFVL
jgi:hypothetical protein